MFGFIVSFGVNVIMRSSKQQSTVSPSTCNSEINAITESENQGVLIKYFYIK